MGLYTAEIFLTKP